MDRFMRAAAEYERLASVARKAAARAFDPLDAPAVQYLARLFQRGLHEGAEQSLRAGQSEQALNFWDTKLADFRRWRVEQDAEEAAEYWGASAKRLLTGEGRVVDPADREAFGRLCLALNDAALAESAPIQDLLRGHIVEPPAEPRPPITPVPHGLNGQEEPGGPSAVASFGRIAAQLLENPRSHLGAATKQAYRTALRFLSEAVGDLPPSKLTKRRVAEFLDLLAQRPAKLPKAERALPLSKVVERYRGQDVSRLTWKTLEQHRGSLASIWSKSQDRGDIAEGLPNPFKQKIAAGPSRATEKGLTKEELQAIFALPVFTRGERPKRGKGEASYWIPLLLLWTGARPEELAQLLVSDVYRHEETHRWMLRITDEGDHPHKGKRSLKTAKSQSGRRTFPIPAKLLELGFLAYVDSVRTAGEAAMFPKLRTRGERGLLFAGFGEWWSDYVREHRVPLAPGKRPAREFRHVWTTAARASGLRREAMEYIQGHTASGGSAHEGYGSREPLGLAMDELRFDGLDLSAVKPWGRSGS